MIDCIVHHLCKAVVQYVQSIVRQLADFWLDVISPDDGPLGLFSREMIFP